jgi:hypothetical protein
MNGAIPWLASTFFLAGVLVGIGLVLFYIRSIDAD